VEDKSSSKIEQIYYYLVPIQFKIYRGEFYVANGLVESVLFTFNCMTQT